ncbi:DUF1760-domain-containing protein [Pseudovirgaria hyperparasitica]|uniref:DUF1760-domain-containing protein n=1 Tax=Pseudovirgaria hyperparasitica TaxID=470096 RepID=A0A6A6W980_9PEZI|nr:DUF1760-domain-containing protein [Pseudovirgaria hyperparasitica]KAF2759105.1 DUF1760-domain-containing protein [Pseudovirgaria hyperparasitica]
MAEQQHPLRVALPKSGASVDEYNDYLVRVEPHLTKENLPILHDILQDTEVTIGTGWDLVRFLLPLLPESESCLQDIARLGNPREVILKVAEALRQQDLEYDALEADGEDYDTITSNAGPSGAPQTNQTPPLAVLQFQSLLSMLTILHPRLKTRNPSGFLAMSLPAVLTSYSKASSHFGELTGSVITLIKTLFGSKRPHLPPRKSSSHVPTVTVIGVATDPEAEAGSEAPGAEESKVVTRLLQGFLTHVLEEYMLHLRSNDDVPGLAWSSRTHEKFSPGMSIPGKPTFKDRFEKDEHLQNRILVVSQVVALGRELGIDSQELYSNVINPADEPTGEPFAQDETPASAEDISFSRVGSLFLFTARTVALKLYDNASGDIGISIFPEHDSIVKNFLNTTEPVMLGTENEALIDAILVLGIIALEDNDFGEPENDEQFTGYLQLISLLSANTSSPTLRYHAHMLTSTVLRSYPDEFVRLTFIRDTLEHCPYENLKVSAVGWLKGETLEANTSTLGNFNGLGISHTSTTALSAKEETSIFATPIALSTAGPFLFPDLTHDLGLPTLSESYTKFKAEISFYLAVLNFYYLLLSAKPLHAILNIAGLHEDQDIGRRFLGPLTEASNHFREGLQEGGELREWEGNEGCEHGLFEIRLLDDVLDRIQNGVAALTKE